MSPQITKIKALVVAAIGESSSSAIYTVLKRKLSHYTSDCCLSDPKTTYYKKTHLSQYCKQKIKSMNFKKLFTLSSITHVYTHFMRK